VPGTLAQTLAQQARVLVIDDIQHLRTEEATSLLAPLLLGPTALGRVIVVGRDPLTAAVGAAIAEVELHGLDADAAGQLWASLEETYGDAEGFDAAFARTRGVVGARYEDDEHAAVLRRYVAHFEVLEVDLCRAEDLRDPREDARPVRDADADAVQADVNGARGAPEVDRSMRLVHDVTDHLEERVEEVAETLAGHSLLSQVAMKEIIASDLDDEAGLEKRMEHWMRLVRDSGEAAEGAAAFLDRRPPDFPWKPQRAQREER